MPDTSAAEKRRVKLNQLVESEGYPNLDKLLRDASFDSACPGICQTPGCDYSTDVKRQANGPPDRHPIGTLSGRWDRLVPVANGRAPRAAE